MEASEREEEKVSPVCSSTEEDTDDESEPEPAPVVRRKVSFADAFGLDLVSVKEFGDIDASSAGSPAVEDYYVSCVFTVPSNPEELDQKLELQQVELESVELIRGTTTLRGFVRVVNLCYDKSVFARVTLDDWSSYFDLLADYVPGSSDRRTDRFTFSYTLVPPFEREGTRLEFCLRYETPVGIFWANNNGGNYVIFCHQRGAAKEGQENSEGQAGKKSCLKANRKRSTEEGSWSSFNGGTMQDSTLLLRDQRTLVESQKRRQRAARLARVQDLLSERRGEKRCDLRDLQSHGKQDKPSQILTYHQIPLLTLDWRDGDGSKSAAILGEPSKVATNDTQSEPIQNSSEGTLVDDSWRAFLNRPADREESIALESDWLQMATSVSPSKRSVSQQIKTGELKDFLLVEPEKESLTGETSAREEWDEGTAKNCKLLNQGLSESEFTLGSTQAAHPSSDKADETGLDDLPLHKVKGEKVSQDQASALPTVDENRCAEMPFQNHKLKCVSQENNQMAENKEERESKHSKTGYHSLDKHLDVGQGALRGAYFKTKTATQLGEDVFQRINEKQGDSRLKQKVENSDTQPGDVNLSGLIQEKQEVRTTQSKVLEKIQDVTNDEVTGKTRIRTVSTTKTVEGIVMNHGSKDNTDRKTKEAWSIVSGPCQTDMKEMFTVVKPEKMSMEGFVENVIKGVWEEVFIQKAADKDSESLKHPPADKCTFKTPEVLQTRWTFLEEEIKSQNKDVSGKTNAGLQLDTLHTSQEVIRTTEGGREGLRAADERKDTPIQRKAKDIVGSERMLPKGNTEAAPDQSFIVSLVENLFRGVWEEVFCQITGRHSTCHHQNSFNDVFNSIVQETEENQSTPAGNQSEVEHDRNFVAHHHMTDASNCKPAEAYYHLEKESETLSGSVLSCQMISLSGRDDFSSAQRVTRAGVEPDTFYPKLQSHLSLRAHLSQDFNTSLAPLSRQTGNVVGRCNNVTDTSRGNAEQSSTQQIPLSKSDTTNEALDDAKQSKLKAIDSLSPSVQTSNLFKDQINSTLLQERVITLQADQDSLDSAPHHGPPIKKSKEDKGLVWWSLLYILSHLTNAFITGLFVTGFFVFVWIFDFQVFFALYVLSTFWCFYKWRGVPMDKSRGT